MSSLSETEKQYLLTFARKNILEHLGEKSIALPDVKSPVFQEKSGCFVTLHAGGLLRGCIGTIEPIKALMDAVRENAVHAGFHDPRFKPVTLQEMENITIEISVLTTPIPLRFQNEAELKQQIKPGVHGVILSRGYCRATFLPQVWDQVPGIETFLEHLCQKAGMEKTCWKDMKTAVEVYEVFAFSENDKKPDEQRKR